MGDNFHITEEMKAKPPGQSDLLGPANCYPPAQPAPDAEYVWPAEDTCVRTLETPTRATRAFCISEPCSSRLTRAHEQAPVDGGG